MKVLTHLLIGQSEEVMFNEIINKFIINVKKKYHIWETKKKKKILNFHQPPFLKFVVEIFLKIIKQTIFE